MILVNCVIAIATLLLAIFAIFAWCNSRKELGIFQEQLNILRKDSLDRRRPVLGIGSISIGPQPTDDVKEEIWVKAVNEKTKIYGYLENFGEYPAKHIQVFFYKYPSAGSGISGVIEGGYYLPNMNPKEKRIFPLVKEDEEIDLSSGIEIKISYCGFKGQSYNETVVLV